MPPPNTFHGRGWSVGFVEFYTTEQATLAKQNLSEHDVEPGVRLFIRYARMRKPPAPLAGHFGVDHGGAKFGFGWVDGGHAKVTERGGATGPRGRFVYEKVDWETEEMKRKRPRF